MEALEKLTPYYGNRLPEFQRNSFWDLQNHIKINCLIGTNDITYFLDIPILNLQNYELFLLKSVPSLVDDNYITVIPSTRFAAKSTDSDNIIFFNQNCEPGLNHYFCPKSSQLYGDQTCERNILTKGLNGACELIQLKITANHIEFLEEIRRYILIFPQEDQIKIIKPEGTEFKTLKGIFMTYPGHGTIEYKNQTLIAPVIETANGPSIIKHIKQPWDLNMDPVSTIKLKNLQYLTPQSHPITLQSYPTIRQLFTPSIWTILLYTILTSCFSVTIYKYYQNRRKLNLLSNNSNQGVEL